MELQPTSGAGVLRSIEALLDGFDAATVGRGQLLGAAQHARELASRLSAISSVLLAKADAAEESLQASGTPTTSWLAIKGGLSKREAAGALHQARDLAAHPDVADAASAGRITVNQARAIGSVLGGLDGLDDAQQAQAEQVLLDLAAVMDTDRLAKAGPQVLTRVAPEHASEALERRLQLQAEAAHRNRSLVFGRDGHGSVTFSGSLPLVEGEAWISILEAYTESQRRTALEERDPLATGLTPQQRRADALVAMVVAHAEERRAPTVGGDRPQVVVLLDYEKLRAQAAGAGLIGEDEPISAGDLRRLCCDANLLPAVLDGAGATLDVGRSRRLVTRELRAALLVRDRGCVFSGCQARPAQCEAHHIVPWFRGGATAVRNLVLLCHHHHALVEPARYGTRDQWEIRLATDGLPETIPPARYDPRRTPLRHARHQQAHCAEATHAADAAAPHPPAA